MKFTAEIIAQLIDGKIEGDKTKTVSHVSKIEEANCNSLVFLSNLKYEEWLYRTDASVVIINKTLALKKSVSATIIRVEDAYSSFAKLLKLYSDSIPKKSGVSEQCVINSSAKIGDNVYIGEFVVVEQGVTMGNNNQIYPHVYIGDNVTIGNNCILHSGVKIYHDVVLGNNIIIHSGSVIGADGFGFAPNLDDTYSKIPQIGNVIIEDDVEIGANTCIDRATMGSTVIRQGVKLDNLIQVAHNVQIGKNSVMAAQVGIAGSVKIGENVMFGGQVGIAGHLSIANKVKVSSKSGITNNIKIEGETYFGTPVAMPGYKYHRIHATLKHLPDLRKQLIALTKEVTALSEEVSKAKSNDKT